MLLGPRHYLIGLRLSKLRQHTEPAAIGSSSVFIGLLFALPSFDQLRGSHQSRIFLSFFFLRGKRDAALSRATGHVRG